MKAKALSLAFVLAALAPAQASGAPASSRKILKPSASRTRATTRAAARPAAARNQAESWARYTYPGEEFSVELPSVPFVYDSSRQVGIGRDERVRVFGAYSGGVVYILTSFDRPGPKETPDYFANYPFGKGHDRAARDISLGGFAGREYVAPDGATVRAFLARGHAYVLRALTEEGDAGARGARRFLDSLALGDAPGGADVYEPPQPPAVPAKKSDAEKVKESRKKGARPEVPPEGPFLRDEVERKALIVFKWEPSFTQEARDQNVTGTVRLNAVLAYDGRVTDVSVARGLPAGLTEEAVRSARHMLFFPARKGGRAVSQYVTLEYDFRIY